MSEPVHSKKQPYVVTLGPGSYYWCACGLSKRPPYCDGSHRSTLHSPMKVETRESVELRLCGCRQSGQKPYCDGSHEKPDAPPETKPR